MKTIAILFIAAAITGVITTGPMAKQNPQTGVLQLQLAEITATNNNVACAHDLECDHVNGLAYNDDIIDMLTGRKVSTTLGDPVYDRKMREEVQNQRQFFQGVPAEVVKSTRGLPHSGHASLRGSVVPLIHSM